MGTPWKQAIPTNLLEYTQGDTFAATIFCLLLLRTRNTPGVCYVNNIPIALTKGQCIAGRYELARWVGLRKEQSGRIFRALTKLQSLHLIDKRKGRDCSIITIRNFDTIVGFEQTNELSIDHQQTNHRQSIDTNKRIKSYKSDKIHKQGAIQQIQDILKDKCTIKDGNPYILKNGTWELIRNPEAFAASLTNQESHEAPQRLNPILEDLDFQKYLTVYPLSDDISMRKKMILEEVLGRRYYGDQFSQAWREANEALRKGGTK